MRVVGMVRVVRVVAARAARVAGVVGVVAVRAVRVARMGAGDGEGADAVPWFPIPAASAGGGCSSTKERNKHTLLVFPKTLAKQAPQKTHGSPPSRIPVFQESIMWLLGCSPYMCNTYSTYLEGGSDT